MCHDCRRGEPCVRCLAEDHPSGSRHVCTVHLGGQGVAHFPETDGQTLTAGAAKAAYVIGLRVLGLDPADFLVDA